MILIGLGSNLPFLNLTTAKIILAARDAVEAMGPVSAMSSLYESEAWPDPKAPPYVNAVLRLETIQLPPIHLMHALHVIEASFGRDRARAETEKRYASRTLDIDLLCYDDLVNPPDEKDGLKLPHPSIQDRDFVLLPLRDVAPGWRHPVTGATADEMLSQLKEVGGSFTAKPLDLMDIN